MKGWAKMKLNKIECCENHDMVDYMIKKNIMNDYVFNNTFITFTFSEPLKGIKPDDRKKRFVGAGVARNYLYRLLWETCFIRNSKLSTHKVLEEEIQYSIKCNLSEVINFLESAVPPVLKKGHKIIELMGDINEIVGTCYTLFTEPNTLATNFSYFCDTIQMKPISWISSYQLSRADAIARCIQNSGESASVVSDLTKVIADVVVGNPLSSHPGETIITLTFDESRYSDFMKYTQSDIMNDGLIVTDIGIERGIMYVTVVMNLGKIKIDSDLYGIIRNTYDLLSNYK